MPSQSRVTAVGSPTPVSTRESATVLLRPEWVFSIAREVDRFVRSQANEASPPGGLEQFFTSLPRPEHDLEHRILNVLHDSLRSLAPDGQRSRAEQARQLLLDEYQRPWTLDGLARAVGCNRTTLQEEFRQLTRTTVHRFLVHRRVAAAQQLLRESDLKASRISVEVGYRSNSAFTRHFKSVTGVTLATFRSERRCTAAD